MRVRQSRALRRIRAGARPIRRDCWQLRRLRRLRRLQTQVPAGEAAVVAVLAVVVVAVVAVVAASAGLAPTGHCPSKRVTIASRSALAVW